MNTIKRNEVNLMRSGALAVLFSMLVTALILLPLFTSAKGREKVNNNGKVYMHSLGNQYRASVTLTNFEEGKYTLTVESKDGVEVYYNTLLDSPEKFSKIFDFSRLQDGEYTLKVQTRNGAKERHFDIKNGKVYVHYDEKETPEFKPVGQKAVLVMPNSSNNMVSIRILSPEGEELYSKCESKEEIRKMFDFSKVDDGTYKVLVSSNNRDFAFDFKK